MTLGFVVQRYGQAINGGAELHARYIAERLARHVKVEVLTTCATDYVTWRNALVAGVEQVNGIAVRRFPVAHERETIPFAKLSERVFNGAHSINDELEWLDAEGPTSPGLIEYIKRHAADYDFLIFFSYRYYHAYHGVRAAASRAILVPTAERDSTIGLSIFKPVFRGVRALMYNSPEERAMIQSVAGNHDVPSVVVGVGSDVPQNPQAARFRQKHNIRGPFAVYVGRIDENKGCRELFAYFQSYLGEKAGHLTLVLIGNSILDIPRHPRIRHLGFLDDTDKFDAIAASEVLIMPSFLESLSMVALEAWALGRPVLANAHCDVLKGQCIRSSAGLYYAGELEFVETLRAIEQNRWLAGSLGKNGRQYYRDHYDWPVIERKYLDMLDRLGRSPSPSAMPSMPGWLARRKADCPAGADVVATLPAGPAAGVEPMPPRPAAVAAPAPHVQPPHVPSPPVVSRERQGRGDYRRGRQGSRSGGRSSASGRAR